MSGETEKTKSLRLWDMASIETIADFYKRKFNQLPEDLQLELGHFNVFPLEPYAAGMKPIPYKRRDFFKIMLVEGKSQVHYADRIWQIEKQALSFSNPQIPYSWEHLENKREGFFCIFNQQLFHQFGNLSRYSVFQPAGKHLFELTDEQAVEVEKIYSRMFQEISSDYIHKYDVLRNLVFELIHYALKLDPEPPILHRSVNAAGRIASLFLDLLERQFPIDETHPALALRSASDFATQLNVHVNHLNRAVKEQIGKTTTQVIAERIAQEGKILLRHSPWTISEIAYALGFTEPTHFNSFFRKQTNLSPSGFRKIKNSE